MFFSSIFIQKRRPHYLFGSKNGDFPLSYWVLLVFVACVSTSGVIRPDLVFLHDQHHSLVLNHPRRQGIHTMQQNLQELMQRIDACVKYYLNPKQALRSMGIDLISYKVNFMLHRKLLVLLVTRFKTRSWNKIEKHNKSEKKQS